MKYLRIVQRLQPLYNLNENFPNLFFFKVSLVFLMLCNFLEQIAMVCVLHNDTTDFKT